MGLPRHHQHTPALPINGGRGATHMPLCFDIDVPLGLGLEVPAVAWLWAARIHSSGPLSRLSSHPDERTRT